MSSDDFTTIPRHWLRLFQKRLRLFLPERYDYCCPLLAIGRKPEKSCGESRQWFRAGLAWSAVCCTVWRGSITGAPLHPYIPYYNRRLCCPVQRPAWRWYLVCAGGAAALWCAPAWRVWYCSRLCGSNIYGGRMGQIAGNAPVKPCALFCGVGGITALTAQNAL